MNAHDLKKKLESIIEFKLSPLIDNDYVYWDLPYHVNIGDTLIWQGTLDFLSNKSYKMIDYGNFVTADFNCIRKDTIILLHGGGNFGDIYGSSQDFRKRVVAQYPNNKIIILPQTIYFESKINEKNDLLIFSNHKNLYLCVRDQISYDLACQYISHNNVLFLPDMAFCIKEETLIKGQSTNRKLLMNRIDKEASLVDDKYLSLIDRQSDWPSFEKEPRYCMVLRYLNGIDRRLNKKNGHKALLSKIIDFYALNYVRPKLIKTGRDFINEFDVIYTTRLHGCILSLLLDKEIMLLDNSYGKNKAYYNAWLKDSDNVKVASC